jgi:hypothetical protein
MDVLLAESLATRVRRLSSLSKIQTHVASDVANDAHCSRCRSPGDGEMERAADAFFGVDPNAAGVAFDDFFADCQADAGAGEQFCSM